MLFAFQQRFDAHYPAIQVCHQKRCCNFCVQLYSNEGESLRNKNFQTRWLHLTVYQAKTTKNFLLLSTIHAAVDTGNN